MTDFLSRARMPEVPAETFALNMWCERLKPVPRSVLLCLLRHHEGQLDEFLGNSMVLSPVQQFTMQAAADWHDQHMDTYTKTIEKLSRGFRVPSFELATLFAKDDYVGTDTANVLLHPETPARTYPDRTLYTCQNFMRIAEGFTTRDLYDDIDTFRNQARTMMSVCHMRWIGLAGQATMLTQLDQSLACAAILPAMSDNLAKGGHHNLVTLSDAFAARARAIAADIITLAQAAMLPSPLQAGKSAPKPV